MSSGTRGDLEGGLVLPAEAAWPSVVGVASVVCGLAIALSAFLLFLVEPLVGRLALPVFGGVPAVWATVLCFFQGVLLLGYLYGHLSVSRLGLRQAAALHVAVTLLALGAALVAPTRLGGLIVPGMPTALNLLWMLALTIGLPTFLMTSTTPLVSAWYVALRRGGGLARDPYWLYALSNGGSLLALLLYPLAIEPTLGLRLQRSAWVVAFGVLAALLVALAVLVVRWLPPAAAERPVGTVAAPAISIGTTRRLRWLLLAAVPSGLLAAVTNFITTDLISAPLLWVGPLAVYLASLIVVFSARGRVLVRPAVMLAPVAVTLLWVPLGSVGGWPALALLVLELVGLAVVAVALHGLLALDRPAPGALTEFYLLLSAGGVLGSALVALVAPVAFKGIWEYPILLVGALVALAVSLGSGWRQREETSRDGTPRSSPVAAPRGGGLGLAVAVRSLVAGTPGRLVPYLAAAAILVLLLATDRSVALDVGVRWLALGAIVLVFAARPRVLAITTAVVLIVAVFVVPPANIFQARNFFGVVQVLRPAGGLTTELRNGTTTHGSQWRDPAIRDQPINEFARSGPAGDLFSSLADHPDGGRAIAVVGLGAGELAMYARPGDSLAFYEINPLDIQVASDPQYFTYLHDAAVSSRIVEGDGRLSLQQVASGTFDILVLDAFSSDAVPVHLLTVEAITGDVRVLRTGGALAFHLSNRYYDLEPAVAAAIEHVGLTALVKNYEPPAADQAAGAAASSWLVATRDAGLVGRLAALGWHPEARQVAPLTDDFPDITRLLNLPW